MSGLLPIQVKKGHLNFSCPKQMLILMASCNKTVIYLLAVKYAVDMDRKSNIDLVYRLVNNDFLVHITAYFTAKK